MSGDSMILLLPLEILKEISLYLSIYSMSSLVRVSRSWRKVWEEPVLWTQVRITLKSGGDLATTLRVKRFSAIRSLQIRKLNKETLEVIKNNKTIRCLDVCYIDHDINEDEFAHVMTRVESLKMPDSYDFTTKQMSSLFQKISEMNGITANLKKLTLRSLTLRGHEYIDCNLLANCFMKVEELDFYAYCLTKDQTTALFNHCGEANRLKKLTARLNWDLFHIEPLVFANFFSKREKVIFKIAKFDNYSSEQLEELFRSIGDDNGSMLKDLHLDNSGQYGWGYIESVNPDILARAINKLERVNISHNNMTEVQFRKIINQMMVQTNLKMLDVRANKDLPGIHDIQKLLEKVKDKVNVLLDEKSENDDTDDCNTDVYESYFSDTDDYEVDEDSCDDFSGDY